MKIIKETSYEDGIKIAENYAKYERKISELEKHIKTIYELIAGDNATDWPQDEMIDYIKVLNRQIAEWQDKEDETKIEFTVEDLDREEIRELSSKYKYDENEDEDEITEEDWCKQEGNYTTDQMNGEEITR